jgi:hypothetical protein
MSAGRCADTLERQEQSLPDPSIAFSLARWQSTLGESLAQTDGEVKGADAEGILTGV